MGGMQKHSYYLAKYFARAKIKVDLYYYLPTDKTAQLSSFTDEENKYIEHIIIDMPKADKYIGHYLRQCLSYSKNIYEILIKRERTDFIYAQGFTAWAIFEKKTSRYNLPKIGVNFHGLEPLQNAADLKSNLQKYMLKPYLLYNLKKADIVFSLGSNLTNLLVKSDVALSKIIQIPIGIEKEWLVDSIKDINKPLQFVFVGRNERRKGVIELYSAIKNINQEKAIFNFIGPIALTDLEKKRKKTIRTNNQNLIFHGAIYNQHKIKEIVEKCDVLICPSYSEGMPTVILEAMSCGLTVIATNVGATNELVNENTGFLIKNPKPIKISQAINKVLYTEENKLLQLKSNALKQIQDSFLWENVIKNTISKIENFS
jgi:glycosyltransferase involved in cell wall biosynthesis